MIRFIKRRMNTWLVYKLLCTLKWFLTALFRQGSRRVMGIIDDHGWDRRLNIETSDFIAFDNTCDAFRGGVCRDGNVFQSTSYRKLKLLASYLALGPDDVFVDLGTGKGRTVLFFAQYPLKKALGVELKDELVLVARANLARMKPAVPVTIIHADALTVDLTEGTVFFLYNPFGWQTMSGVLENIRKSLVVNPRRVRIVYFNCVHAALLDAQDWLEREKVMENEQEVIWHSKL